jgi:hypothetical protein
MEQEELVRAALQELFAPQRRRFQGGGARRGLEGERQTEADVLQSMVNIGRRLR